MNKVLKYLKSILLSPMWIMMGGGGGGEPDPNKTTKSQQALWSQYASDWNKFITEVEPRTEYAYNKAANLPETRSLVQNQMRTSAIDAANPVQTLGNKQSLTTNLIRGNANMGNAIAGANVKGGEAAKDYQSQLLGNILASKMGAKAGTQTALGTFAGNETSNYLQNLQNTQQINQAMTKANSAAITGIGYNMYAGAEKMSSPQGKVA